jgi:hypothetical protein
MISWLSTWRTKAESGSPDRAAAIRLQAASRRHQVDRQLQVEENAAVTTERACRRFLASVYARRAREDRLWDHFEGDKASKTTKPIIELCSSTSLSEYPQRKNKHSIAVGGSASVLVVVAASLLLTAVRISTREMRMEAAANVTQLSWLSLKNYSYEAAHKLSDGTCVQKEKQVAEASVWERSILLAGMREAGRRTPAPKTHRPVQSPQHTLNIAENSGTRISKAAIDTIKAAAGASRALVRSCGGWLRRLLSKAATDLLLSKDCAAK